MDKDSIDAVMEEARDYWHAQTGKSADTDFDPKEAVALYCDFNDEEMEAIGDYVENFVAHGLAHLFAKQMVSGDGVSPQEIIEIAIGSTIPVGMILSRHRAGRRKDQVKDNYLTTVMAEARINQAVSDGEDLNQIWPKPVIDEVLQNWSPEDAFRIGVLCGQNG